ncbi:unnamed protein product [Lampetra planeri]
MLHQLQLLLLLRLDEPRVASTRLLMALAPCLHASWSTKSSTKSSSRSSSRSSRAGFSKAAAGATGEATRNLEQRQLQQQQQRRRQKVTPAAVAGVANS